ncbi:MAG: ATP-binding protein [Candidatus Nealsonbacteria bacterium]|nr:ATP-binding protein [Candidatus Nealsonbacteria bacterium]
MNILIFQNLYIFFSALVIICIFLIEILTIRSKKKIELQKTAIDYLFDGLIIIDRSRVVRELNPKAEEMLGVQKKKIVGKIFSEKLKTPYFESLIRIISVMAEKGKREWKDIIIEKPRRLVLRVTPIPIFNKKRKWTGYIFILHDVTREKEIDKVKSEFITIAAHKLRTPLSEVKWGIGSLMTEKEKLSSDQRELLENCYQANDRIIFEVDSLLNVSDLEKGLFKYKFIFESLEDIVAEVVQNMSEFAKKQGVSLKYQEPPETLPEVKVDKDKISIVVYNLLDNALRYTPKGGKVLIGIREKDKFLVVSIKDTGIGISPLEQKLVFTKFFRSERAMKIHTEGLGLNLFVVKNIVEKHEGKIWFESEENQGTTSHFKLPILK